MSGREGRRSVDTFKAVVVLSVVVCIASLVVIGVVTEEAIRTASIPDSQSGVVLSKAAVSDKPSAMFAVTLVGGKVLYIQNNSLIYNSVVENQSFRFDCRIDYNNNMIFIESVNPQMGLVTAKAPVTDGTVQYSITLANGRTLYITNNATLYNTINVNQQYLFDCSIDYSNNRFLIGSIKPFS